METPEQPKRGRGRPKGSTKAKPSCDTSEFDNSDMKSAKDFKRQLTQKEMNFLEIYFAGGVSIDRSMILAGYGNYSQDGRYYIAKKIKEKYELQTRDHRKIMRALGYGEVKILRLLIDSATKAKSETVMLNARVALAKCLGLQTETLEAIEGIQIVIKSGGGQHQADKPKPAQPRALPAPSGLPQTRMITD